MRVFPKGKSRAWYSALMDYGASLKRSGIKLNSKHSKYVKQGKFVGSNREARGAILHVLTSEPSVSHTSLIALLGPARRPQLREVLATLQREGLIEKNGTTYTLAN